jgi:AraC-like DNA-binding protein
MKSTNPDDYQHVPGPVAGMPKNFPAGSRIAPHRHQRAQLAWAVSGVMTVTVGADSWVVPPQRAVWIPAGTLHRIYMSGPVAMRSLYIEPAMAAATGLRCKVIPVTGLLRELLLEMAEAPLDYPAGGRIALIASLILEEIRARPPQRELHLPMPRDPRLSLICEALLAEPARPDGLDDWAEAAGASSRTLARLFARELGMRFVDWRAQARLALAVARLAEGDTIGIAAAAAGYRSPSAFTAMFRKTLGTAPRDYFTASA